jgi:L-glyceraldehyde 3-phosphate reductase
MPKGTRVSENSSFSKDLITKNNLKIINNLNLIAKKRGQSLSQLALAWVLNNKAVTSALIGVRSVAQLKDNLAALNNLKFSKDELKKIDKNAKEGNINLWAPSSSY